MVQHVISRGINGGDVLVRAENTVYIRHIFGIRTVQLHPVKSILLRKDRLDCLFDLLIRYIRIKISALNICRPVERNPEGHQKYRRRHHQQGNLFLPDEYQIKEKHESRIQQQKKPLIRTSDQTTA